MIFYWAPTTLLHGSTGGTVQFLWRRTTAITNFAVNRGHTAILRTNRYICYDARCLITEFTFCINSRTRAAIVPLGKFVMRRVIGLPRTLQRPRFQATTRKREGDITAKFTYRAHTSRSPPYYPFHVNWCNRRKVSVATWV